MPDADVVAAWYTDAPTAGGSDSDWFDWWSQRWNPEIEWRAIEGAPDDVGPIRGAEQLARYYAEWTELFDDLRIEPIEVRNVGDRVVAALHVSGRSRSTDMPLGLDYAVVLDFDDQGRMKRGREFATLDEALAAATPDHQRRE